VLPGKFKFKNHTPFFSLNECAFICYQVSFLTYNFLNTYYNFRTPALVLFMNRRQVKAERQNVALQSDKKRIVVVNCKIITRSTRTKALRSVVLDAVSFGKLNWKINSEFSAQQTCNIVSRC
jgi:hypothetical protein